MSQQELYFDMNVWISYFANECRWKKQVKQCGGLHWAPFVKRMGVWVSNGNYLDSEKVKQYNSS